MEINVFELVKLPQVYHGRINFSRAWVVQQIHLANKRASGLKRRANSGKLSAIILTFITRNQEKSKLSVATGRHAASIAWTQEVQRTTNTKAKRHPTTTGDDRIPGAKTSRKTIVANGGYMAGVEAERESEWYTLHYRGHLTPICGNEDWLCNVFETEEHWDGVGWGWSTLLVSDGAGRCRWCGGGTGTGIGDGDGASGDGINGHWCDGIGGIGGDDSSGGSYNGSGRADVGSGGAGAGKVGLFMSKLYSVVIISWVVNVKLRVVNHNNGLQIGCWWFYTATLNYDKQLWLSA